MDLNKILVILAVILFFIVIVLSFIYLAMMAKQNKKKAEEDKEKSGGITKTKTFKPYTVESIFDFMEFEKIENNMIIQKDGKRYVMAVECQGINYDLMSDVERTSVENGFIQFLNTLRAPIQLYIQTRTVNLEKSLQTYKDRLGKIQSELEIKENRYKQMVQSGHYKDEQIRKQKIEVEKQRNLCNYGRDIISNTEKTNLNQSVLKKKYYIIIYHYYSGENEFLDEDEIKDYVFTDLYTRAQSIIRTLYSTGVSGKILDSQGLVDLLYNSYNRDEAESYGIEKANVAGYDQLYSTAPDILEKRMKALDAEIEKRAVEIAEEAVLTVKNEREVAIETKEENLEDLINSLAKDLIEENKQYIGNNIAKKATSIIDNNTKSEKKGDVSNEKKQRRTRIKQ